jgi:hypothetical protein
VSRTLVLGSVSQKAVSLALALLILVAQFRSCTTATPVDDGARFKTGWLMRSSEPARAIPELGPEDYVRWRASAIGAITEDLERQLILELVGDVTGFRVLDVGSATENWPSNSGRAARLWWALMHRRR